MRKHPSDLARSTRRVGWAPVPMPSRPQSKWAVPPGPPQLVFPTTTTVPRPSDERSVTFYFAAADAWRDRVTMTTEGTAHGYAITLRLADGVRQSIVMLTLSHADVLDRSTCMVSHSFYGVLGELRISVR